MKWRVLIGINYPNPKSAGPRELRAEPGTVVGDLPTTSLGWLVEQGIVEAADQPARAWVAERGLVAPDGGE